MATVKFVAAGSTLSISQTADLIAAVGDKVTVLVQGDMGSGKTSILRMLAKRFPKHYPAYFDCTTKDLGDIMIPHIKDAEFGAFVRFAVNEEFGLQHGRPVILMLDEIGKNRSIQNPLLRVMQERHIGNMPLPEGSIVFATTNLGAENVGDTTPPHARNRIMPIHMRKPNCDEWKAWALDNDIDASLIAAAGEFPSMFASFTDYSESTEKENHYIYDPRVPSRTAFVTPRSLEKLSYLLKKRHVIGEEIVLAGAVGLVGPKAAHDIMTIVQMGDVTTQYEEIITNPTTAKVPDNAAPRIIVTIKCLQNVSREDFTSVFTYIRRMPMEMTALFCQQIMKMPTKQGWVVDNADFKKFLMAKFNMFTKV